MGLVYHYEEGQTPIDEDEKNGLKIKTISTLVELNEFEQQNIESALLWLKSKKLSYQTIFREEFIKKLHSMMYNRVWTWAGSFRNTTKNIGVLPYEIPLALKSLIDDTKFWIENEIFPPEEIAIRFKHRIVSIHCFPNGNGRHSRVIANVIMEKIFQLPKFTWGRNQNLSRANETRKNYISALKKAVNNDYKPLIEFAKS